MPKKPKAEPDILEGRVCSLCGRRLAPSERRKDISWRTVHNRIGQGFIAMVLLLAVVFAALLTGSGLSADRLIEALLRLSGLSLK